MLQADIFQTIENRGNDLYIEEHGPFFCSAYNSDGSIKKGIKEPWLGEGYYFWDTRLENAQWWGETVYSKNGYIICKTTYDQHSPLLYDLVGVVSLFDEFRECAKLIKERLNLERVSFPVVLSYMKRLTHFKYKAIRVWPSPKRFHDTEVDFPDAKIGLYNMDRIQICFFDKTLLTEPYKILKKKTANNEQTI